jgi:hypothetical protein
VNKEYPALLIIDQKEPTYVDWVTNISPEPYVIGGGLAFLVAHHKATVDAYVLVDHDNSVHEIKVPSTSHRARRCATAGRHGWRTYSAVITKPVE